MLSKAASRDRISVILPAFNRHSSVSAAVLSARAELRSGDEIIVVDDASTPPQHIACTGDVAVRLFRSDRNLGAAGARNLGLNEAKGGLIAFLDSDDRWLAGKIDAQRDVLAQAGPGLVAVASGWTEISSGAVIRDRIPMASSHRRDFFGGCWFAPGSTLLLARSVFDRVGLFDPILRRLEDYEWFLRFAQMGGRLVVASIVGAEIVRGGNARPEPLEAAAQRIASLVRDANDVSDAERGDALAYLDLERARAHANVRSWAPAIVRLSQSFLRRPRSQVPLRSWWISPPSLS